MMSMFQFSPTPPPIAANGGQLEMSRWLLENGSDINERDNDGYSPLILAACGGNIELVKFFLDHGASLQERNENGDTALLLAAYCGHVDLVAWLLQNGSSLDERNKTGMGLLVSAANGGHIEVVRLILELTHNATIEDTDDGGYTALLLAAQRSHVEVVQLLAACGANLRARTRRHRNDARSLATDSPAMLDYLQFIWNMAPIQIACDARLVDVVHGWLSGGVDPAECAGPSLRELACSARTYAGARSVCVETLALVELAVRPWTPVASPLYGPNFRAGLMGVFYTQHMVECHTALPLLPSEIWVHIASFFSRGWAHEDSSTALLSADKHRSLWRKKRFGLPTDPELEMVLLCDDDIERPDMMAVDPVPNGRQSPPLSDGKVDHQQQQQQQQQQPQQPQQQMEQHQDHQMMEGVVFDNEYALPQTQTQQQQQQPQQQQQHSGSSVFTRVTWV